MKKSHVIRICFVIFIVILMIGITVVAWWNGNDVLLNKMIATSVQAIIIVTFITIGRVIWKFLSGIKFLQKKLF